MKKMIIVLFCFLIAGVTPSHAQVATPTPNINYCAQPVFSSNAVKPNIMIVQDQSGSMQFPAYIGCNLDGYGANSVGECCVRNTTADGYANDKYRPAQNYYGYFETKDQNNNGVYYQYVAGNNRFEINTACINTDNVGSAGCISGNLLNWITTTRSDVVRKALTGGRRYATDATNVTLQSEGAKFEDTSGTYSCLTAAPAYQAGNRYNVGDTVSYSGNNYVCILGHRNPARAPTNTTYWTPAAYDYVAYFTDNNLNCTFKITASDTFTRRLTISGASCPIGTLTNAYVRVKKDKPVINTVIQDKWGIVHEFYDKASFEFAIFKSDATTNYGKILSGKTATEDTLFNEINTTLPYYGTPTGQAMQSAQEFFRQRSMSLGYGTNNVTNFVSIGDGNKDPWYDKVSTVNRPVPCRQSYILLVSDGNWNVGSVDPAQVAYDLHTQDQRTTALSNGTDLLDTRWRQTVTTYAIYAFGDKDTETRAQGRQSMITTALLGGFDYDRAEATPLPYGFGAVPADSRQVEYPNASCDPLNTWSESCREWDKAKTGLPYNFFEFREDEDGEALVERITDAMFDMVRRSSSGTAASVLASSEGSGANLLQAVYYPKRLYPNGEVEWTGALQNLWYFIDPQLGGSTIREDDGDNALNLSSDSVINFVYKNLENKTKAVRGTGGSAQEIELDDVKNLWEAGGMLWKMDPADRKIYTWINSMTTRANFDVANVALLMDYLQAANLAEAENIIKFTYGYAPPSVPNTYRNRMAQTSYRGTTGTNVWKLGDIVSSTPRSKTSVPLNTYHLPTPDGYNDMTYWLYVNDMNSDGTTDPAGQYKTNGRSYTGANDGMFHAFNLGKLSFTGLGSGQIARLEGGDGKEEWAFIPQNALPYLRYMTAANYCHVFTVDNPPQIFDVSAPGTSQSSSAAARTKNSWRTIVLGSMGVGGACRAQNGSCSSGTDCVKAPVDKNGFREIGRSSYFAIDVTDQTAGPKLLWEFASNTLGFSTSGAAIVKISDPANNMSTNGKWFAVIASGPTGPINTTENQFLGRSDQPLRIFILDLITGAVVREINTNISNAFGGSLYNATIDLQRGDRNPSVAGKYSDDVIYLGYTEQSGTTWTNGGVLRILTDNNPDPATWTWNKVIDNIGPVTSAITHLQDRTNNTLWLYFGTGRYYYRLDSGMTLDDADNQRSIYGVKEPCYDTGTINTALCRTVSGLTNKTASASATAVATDGWYINLAASAGGFKYERVITDPLAAFSGNVFFTTFAPSTEVCEIGGSTYIWAVDYKSGGIPSQKSMVGKVMIQVSSGAIEMKDLADSFSNAGGRKTDSIMGIPPRGQGLSLLLAPKPIKRILQMREK